MNTYFFRFETTIPGINELISVKYEAKNLSSALKLFWIESKDFSCPVKRLSRVYEVMNKEGKCSIRYLKENLKVYTDEN